ncbi:hypothetical protein [Marinifilum flexuosum]|uniref:hypothetical protein n=1 Tax=Marinifilum flexuosum TaxID=1117708 RepID=UPI002492E2BB|nr:hypothetical protein [Marinifilum flexuosum]
MRKESGMKKPKLSDLKSIHEWVRDTSNAEIFFVSLLVYPLFAALYSWTIKTTGLDNYKVILTISTTVLYIIAIIIMKNSQTSNEKMEVDLSVIKNHSKSFKKEYIGFSKLKEKDPRFSEKYLKKLARKYPSELIIASFNKGNETGIKVLKYHQLTMPED